MSRLTAKLDDFLPWNRANFLTQHPLPELVQLELFPQFASDPARPKLPRPPYHQARKNHFGYIPGCDGGHHLLVPIGEKPHLMAPPIFFDHLDRSLPTLKLCGVQFSQMQHLTLQHPLATYSQTFT